MHGNSSSEWDDDSLPREDRDDSLRPLVKMNGMIGFTDHHKTDPDTTIIIPKFFNSKTYFPELQQMQCVCVHHTYI